MTDGWSHSLLLLAAGCLAAALSGCVWFEVDERGIRRRSLLARSFHPWSEIAHVRGRTVTAGRGGEALSQKVIDHEGHVLFGLSPWLGRRQDLVRRIRKERSARRESAAE